MASRHKVTLASLPRWLAALGKVGRELSKGGTCCSLCQAEPVIGSMTLELEATRCELHLCKTHYDGLMANTREIVKRRKS